jgi:hypothetical protein
MRTLKSLAFGAADRMGYAILAKTRVAEIFKELDAAKKELATARHELTAQAR